MRHGFLKYIIIYNYVELNIIANSYFFSNKDHMSYNIATRITRHTLINFCKRNHIKKLSLFGSALHGDMRQDSDVDLLVEFEENYVPGFFALCRMENELSDLLGIKVDLRTPKELSRYFRDEVTRTAEVQYEA